MDIGLTGIFNAKHILLLNVLYLISVLLIFFAAAEFLKGPSQHYCISNWGLFMSKVSLCLSRLSSKPIIISRPFFTQINDIFFHQTHKDKNNNIVTEFTITQSFLSYSTK